VNASPELSAEAKELLDLLLAREGQGASGPPLSRTQERLWRVLRLQPSNTYFNVSASAHLRGTLDVEALRAALEDVVSRHAVLRTTCEERAGAPVQTLHPVAPFELSTLDAAGRAEAEGEARKALETRARAAFRLDHSPLLDALLVRVAGDAHVLGLFTHLFVADGWSTRVLGRELTRAYRNRVAGGPAAPALTLQYADFARGQRDAAAGTAFAADLAYWKGELHGAPARLDLPLDRPYPPAPSYAGRKLSFGIPAAVAESLRLLARREGATLFMSLVAGLHALLRSLSGQADVVVGTLVSNRNRAGSEDLIGTFSNLLALRARLDDDPDFTTLLRHVRDAAVRAYGHQELPFDRLVEDLSLSGGGGRTALVQAMLVLHEQPFAHSLDLPGLVATSFAIDPGGSRYDLSFEIVDSGRDLDLEGSLTCNADVIDAGTARRWLDAYVSLLQRAAQEPARRVSEWTASLPRKTPPGAKASPPVVHAPKPGRDGRLAALWREVLKVDSLSADANFFDLGGHSLLAVRLMERIEQEFGRKLPLSALLEAPTLESLGRLLGEDERPRSALVPIRASGTRQPFYLVHGLGGEVLSFRALAERFDARHPFIGVQDPRVFGDTGRTESIESLAALYFEEVRHAQPKGPYLFGGFCMGSAIAYEMARAAVRQGDSVGLLVLIDPPPMPIAFRARRLDHLRVVWNAALSRLRTGETGGFEADDTPMDMLHRRVLRRYRPSRYSGAVDVVFVEKGPPRAAEDALASLRVVVDGAIQVSWLPGTHLDLSSGQSAPALADILSGLLARAPGAAQGRG